MIDQIKKTLGVKIYTPSRYFTGLTRSEKKKRVKTMIKRREQLKNGHSKKLYKKYDTDYKKTKKSKWTIAFHKKYGTMKELLKKYPQTKPLERISKVTKIPLKVIKEVFKRGQKAWVTGHRPGATASQWGYGRVYAFIMKNKLNHDLDLRTKTTR